MDGRGRRRGARRRRSAGGRSRTASRADPAAAPSRRKVLDAGPARLKVSAGWAARRRAPPALPGLDEARPPTCPTPGLTTTVSVALVPADSASLVPGRAGDEGRGRPAQGRDRTRRRPAGARLPRRPHRRLGPRRLRDPDHARACSRSCARPAAGPRRRRPGASRASTRSPSKGPAPITLNAGTAYRMRAPQTIKTLDATRVRERVALRRSKGPVGQARAREDALASAYARRGRRARAAGAEGRGVGGGRGRSARHRPCLPEARTPRRTGGSKPSAARSRARKAAPRRRGRGGR